eukprot:379437-Hanusia_phi.AAC.2
MRVIQVTAASKYRSESGDMAVRGREWKEAAALRGYAPMLAAVAMISMLMTANALGMQGQHSDVPAPPLRSAPASPSRPSLLNVFPPGMSRKTAEPPRVMKSQNDGAIGLLLGLIFQKCGKSAIAALGALVLGIKALEMNKYITFNGPKMQQDVMDSKTYKYVEVTRTSFLSKLPASFKVLPVTRGTMLTLLQEQVNKFVGIALMALQNNMRGISVALSSFTFGWTIGTRL